MSRSTQGQFFIVTIARAQGKPPDEFFIRATDADAARRRGAFFARVGAEQVIDVRTA